MTKKQPQSDNSSSGSVTDTLQLYKRTPLVPAHEKIRQSPLALCDNERKTDLRGFINLGVIVILAMCGQLVLENFKKYGVMLDLNPPELEVDSLWASQMSMTALFIILVCPIHFLIEKFSWSNLLCKECVLVAHTLNLNLLFCTPMLLTYFNTEASMGTGFGLVLFTITLSLKMISFVHFNHHLKGASGVELEKYIPSISNLSGNPNTLLHFWYFLLAPTLCYQLEYPRSPRIRIRFLLRRLFEVVFCIILGTVIIQQYILITVKNTMPYFNNLTGESYIRVFQRVLKLAVPSLCCWLLFFYGYFHAYLNLVGELLRFGDRGFYKA